MSHDHYFNCQCGYVEIVHDCICGEFDMTYKPCWACKVIADHAETERKRNLDY